MKHRTLREGEIYKKQLARLGNVPRVDEALEVLLWGVCRKPEKFEPVPGMKDCYIAKTTGFGSVPALRLLIKIEDDDHVLLAAIGRESTGERADETT